MATIRARYEKGVFTPLEPLELEEGCEVDVSVPANGSEEQGEPKEWVPIRADGSSTNVEGLLPSDDATDDNIVVSRPDLRENIDVGEPPPGMHPTAWWIANLHKKYPPGSFDHVPTDMSANIDHYAYGIPKRTAEE